MKPLKLVVALSGAALLLVAASAFGQSAHASGARAVVNAKKTSLGTILVTSSGKTLYLDAGDKPPKFACTGGCLQAWPELTTSGAPMAKGAVKASKLGTVKRGSATQVTYAGHPLYTFASDSSSNPTSGEGVNGFYVVSPSGAMIKNSTASTGSSSSGGGSGW
jgi:predicted lipoprotein with Yx(FWY)xxD motif